MCRVSSSRVNGNVSSLVTDVYLECQHVVISLFTPHNERVGGEWLNHGPWISSEIRVLSVFPQNSPKSWSMTKFAFLSFFSLSFFPLQHASLSVSHLTFISIVSCWVTHTEPDCTMFYSLLLPSLLSSSTSLLTGACLVQRNNAVWHSQRPPAKTHCLETARVWNNKQIQMPFLDNVTWFTTLRIKGLLTWQIFYQLIVLSLCH